VIRRAGESDLWVVTTYYNPVRWQSRLRNYRAFRAALAAPLLTVEWDREGSYELTPADAEILVRQRGGDVLWQKERLLGFALDALPAHVRCVAWIDCDVIFAHPGWYERTRRLLLDHDVIQPFRRVIYLDRETSSAVAATGRFDAVERLAARHAIRPSFLDLYERTGDDIARVDLAHRFDPAPADGGYQIMARPAYGHAWAARVEAMRRIGWYERCILGGGDLLFAYGIVGQAEALLANHRSVGWDYYGSAGYRAWAAASAEKRPALACGDETLLHLFHGTLADRQYRSRIDGLARFGLDVERDVAADPGHPWSWTRHGPEVSAYVLEYLRNRNEDA
jgi:hypothetical protein